MKIKIFTGSLEVGGAEHQALLFLQYLLKKKHDVELITIFPNGKYWDYAITHHLPVSSLFQNKDRSLFKKIIKTLSAAFVLRKKLAKNESFIIYSYSDYCNLFAFISTIFKKNVKLVWGIRRSRVGGLRSSEWKIYIAEKICALFSAKVDGIIYNSRSAQDYYSDKLSFASERGYVIPNFVNTEKFKKRILLPINKEKFGLNNSAITIGVFGRIVDGKGHDYFFHAFSMLKQKYNVQGLIIGPSDKLLLAQLKRQVVALGIQNDVVFLDARDDMSDMYNIIDLLCSPSLSEGTSNVILEAMASELPCVVTNVGDSKFIVGNENIVVPASDALKLYDGLCDLIKKRDQWLEIGIKNRNRMLELFNEEMNFGNAEKILLKPVDNSPGFLCDIVELAAAPDKMKKKVLHIINGLEKGGAEAMLVKLLSNMNSGDYEFLVITLTCRNSFDHQYFSHKIKALGINVYHLNINKFNILYKIYFLIRLIKQTKPDIVQTWLYYSDFIGGCCAKLSGVKRIIWSIRCEGVDLGLKGRVIKKLCALLSNFIPDVILMNSEVAANNHISAGYNRKKIETIYNGFNLNEFRPLDNKQQLRKIMGLELPDSAILFGALGRYHDNKDYANLVCAIDKVCQYNQDAFFIICGQGCNNKNQELNGFISKITYKNHLFLIDGTDNSQDYLNMLDFFVLPSRTESFPNVLAEAMLCELPCVATNVGDVKAILSGAGMIVPPQDSIQLADACISMLMKSPAERKELGQRARVRVEQHFSMAIFVEKMQNIYH